MTLSLILLQLNELLLIQLQQILNSINPTLIPTNINFLSLYIWDIHDNQLPLI